MKNQNSSNKMRAIVLKEYHTNLIKVLKNLEIAEIEIPQPMGDQVLVKVEASPCNPSDIAFMRGMYNVKKTLPKVMGFECSGKIVSTGDSPEASILLGKNVSCFSQGNENGTWAEYFLTSAKNCIPLVEEIDMDQAACLSINPFTAFALFELAKARGSKAIVQTAAAGQIGQIVQKFAMQESMDLINIVRKDAHVEELKNAGAKYVLNLLDEKFNIEFAELCEKLNPTTVFEAVGGETTGNILNLMPENSQVVVYGGLSGDNIGGIDVLQTIFHNKSIIGFNLNDFIENQSADDFEKISLQLQNKIIEKQIETKIQKAIKLDGIVRGLLQYMSKMSDGKILIKPFL
ncbi:MAG: zinc-binding dehydrogenase [Bacteroidetes bacterium]|jgi:NADPH:quinone reductase|nr:zinc-binding dehydrogenase [Bacteroidota bacterium]MBT6688078.1 zinc-binding dehydrogenase [Bacteroidota bacterium]MBT7142331.1 zinc-binding dehydrogenase [Bacteroidota bacterium]MBT7491145.1 zinc-binding dehydrogenase [Bacteroidota bacterium]